MIAVAMHKTCAIPKLDGYYSMQVGKAGKQRFCAIGDETGTNISSKNPYYSELTGVYWLWKNKEEEELLGLVHYRRYLGSRKRKWERDKEKRILTSQEAEEILKTKDIIVPKKTHYYIESLYTHYAHTHYPEHLDISRSIIASYCPEYLPAFDQVMRQRSGHMYNMFVMRKKAFKAYCSWLFPILEELEYRVDSSDYSDFQKRYVGRVSELLFNVWLVYNTHTYSVVEAPVVYLGKRDVLGKAVNFLKAKFLGKKYERSM